MSNTINQDLYLSTYQTQKRSAGSNALGKDEFLKILMTQLKYQDPTNPLQDKDFIAQMATFSTLEQLTNMNKTIENFVTQQNQNSLISYQHMIGKEVSFMKNAGQEEDGQALVKAEGVIESIQYLDGNINFVLYDGTVVKAESILAVQAETNENKMMQASQLIGKNVTWVNNDKEENKAVIESVLFKAGKPVFIMNDENASSIQLSQIIKISI